MPNNRSERVATSVTPERKRELEAIAEARSTDAHTVPVAAVLRAAIDDHVEAHRDEINAAEAVPAGG